MTDIRVLRGLRNTESEDRFVDGDLSTADNVDLDNTGKPQTRLATSTIDATASHSLWAQGDMCLVINDSNDLQRINPDYTRTTLTRLSSARRMSYVRLQNTVLMSNGVDKVRLVNGDVRLWGTPRPTVQPTASATAGTLPPGTYQYAMTYRRRDGQESGTGASKTIELAVAGGIQFANLESSTDPEVSDKLIYLSGPNGTELFRVLVVPAEDSTAVFRGPFEGATIRLETQFASPPPAGDIVEVFNGSAYVVRGDVAFYSDPWALERFRLATQFLQFDAPITMWAAVNDGIYVSTAEATWFLTGEHPSSMKARKVLDYGAIMGTAVKTTAQDLDAQGGATSDLVVLFATPNGACVGREGGSVQNMTEKRYAFTSGQRGAGVVRRARGYTQYLTAIEGTGVAGNQHS